MRDAPDDPAGAPGAPARRAKGWRKQEIIAAAAECLMEKGYHATSIEDVARRLGCTKGRIYHHYASKTDLFFAVHREGMAELFKAVEPAAGSAGDGLTVLRAMLLAHAQAMLEHHALETVVAQGVQIHRFGPASAEQRATLDQLIASRDRFEDLFKRQLAVAIAEGTVAALDVSVTVKVLLGALQWSIYWYRPESDADVGSRSALAARMVQPLVDGLRPR